MPAVVNVSQPLAVRFWMNLIDGGSGSVKLGSAALTPHWALATHLPLPVSGRGGSLLGLELLASRFNLFFHFYFKVLMMVSSRN